MKAIVRSPNEDTDFFKIVAEVLQGDTLVPYLFIFRVDDILQTSIDQIKENVFYTKKARSRWYPAETITDADYATDLVLLANTTAQVESLLNS